MTLTALIGPPGTGKTTAIAAEIDRDITAGLPAANLLAISFTRAAAAELRRRCQLPRRQATTLHALAWRTIAQHTGTAPRIATVDPTDSRRVADADQQAITSWADWLAGRELPEHWGEAAAIDDLDKRRNACEPVDTWDDDTAALWAAWKAWKAETGTVDFADLIEQLGELTGDRAPGGPWKIWVDEAQDLTVLEARVVLPWAATCDLRLVGDDDQAIYEWRGADPRQSLGVVEPEHITTLDQSWRCPPRIAEAAQRWMGRASWRVPKRWDPRTGDDNGRILSWDTWDVGAVAEAADRKAARGARVLILAAEGWACGQWAHHCRRIGIIHGLDGEDRWRTAADAGHTGTGGSLRSLLTLAADGDLADGDKAAAMLGPLRASALPGARRKTDAVATVKDIGGITRDLLDHWTDGAIDWDTPWRWWSAALLASHDAAAQAPLAVIDRHGPDAWRTLTPRIGITTIHGAKGLEADLVILDGRRSARTAHTWATGTDAQRDAIRRTIYVALTRARRENWILAGGADGVDWAMVDSA